MRMMIKDILTKNGYNVVGEAENGAKAIEKYKELKPDLVIMDITMPEVDGIQAVRGNKKLMKMQTSLCVQQWDNKQWLLNLYRQAPRIL
jgi:YesN/AraC family two-component response regulator